MNLNCKGNAYNVNDIAIALIVDKETVRRWIRTGKVKAVKHSNKGGFVILESDLMDCIRGTKYEKRFYDFKEIVCSESTNITMEFMLEKRFEQLQKRIMDELLNEREKVIKILKGYYGEY